MSIWPSTGATAALREAGEGVAVAEAVTAGISNFFEEDVIAESTSSMAGKGWQETKDALVL
jgi:glucan biosynthesis protein